MISKDKVGNLIAKSSTKNVPVLVKQSTKNSKRKYSVIKSNDISVNRLINECIEFALDNLNNNNIDKIEDTK